MDLNDFLNIGEKLSVEWEQSAYKSMLQDLSGPNILLCAELTRPGGVPLFVPNDAYLDVIFFRQNGLYIFTALMLGYNKQNNLRYMRLRALNEPIKRQRRSDYRLDLHVPVNVTIRGRNFPNTPAQAAAVLPVEDTVYQSRTLDVSAGGVYLAAPQAYPIGTQLVLDFTLEDLRVEAPGRVVRCIWPNMRNEPYKLGVQFQGIDDKTQQALRKYLLAAQIAMRQRS